MNKEKEEQVLFFLDNPEEKGPKYDDFGKEEEAEETTVTTAPVYYWCSQHNDFGDI